MSGRRGWAWVGAGYLVGSIPAAYLVARAMRASSVLERASAASSDDDAHLLLAEHAGPAAAAVAMAGDVAKAALVAAAARRRAGLTPGWRAATAVAVVAGHAFPPFARPFAGRGLAAAAGVTLVNLPGPMVVAGSTLLAGKAFGHTGLGSTLGFASVPVVAAATGRPRAMVAMGAAVFGVILARRLVGLGARTRHDGSFRSVTRRLFLDADRPAQETSFGA